MHDEEKLIYQLWLARGCGHNPFTIDRLLRQFGSAEEIFKSNLYDRRIFGKINLKQSLNMEKNLDGAKYFLDRCIKDKIRIISIDSPDYPAQLKEVNSPPQILYALGSLPDLNKILGIAVVGTRKCSDDGKNFAEGLARDLSASGAVIVSGMALGIDGASHRGTLSSGGTTIAVLAGGVDRIYPTEHAELYEQIKQNGGILSERPPGMSGRKTFYNERNRIITGLCRGIIIVEGKNRSGTSISAKHALNFNRDLFAVPGSPKNPSAELPNSLLKDGAKLVTEAMDVLSEYASLYPEFLEYGLSLTHEPVSGDTPSGSVRDDFDIEEFIKQKAFNETEEMIIRCFGNSGQSIHFDYIAEQTGLNAGQLGSNLVILQMKKAVRQSAGGQYTINRDL